MFEFTAKEDFFCAETQSHYVKGMSYTVRPAEAYDLAKMDKKKADQIRARCAALAKLVPQWLTEGKITPGRAAPVVVTGQGE